MINLHLPVNFDENSIFNNLVASLIVIFFPKIFTKLKSQLFNVKKLLRDFKDKKVQLGVLQKFLRNLRAKSLQKTRKHRFDQRYFIYQANKENSLFFIFIMVAIFNLMFMLKISNMVWYYQFIILLPTLVFEFKWLMQKSYVEDLIKYQPKIHQT